MSKLRLARLRLGLRLVALSLFLVTPWKLHADEVSGLRTALAAAGAENWAAAAAAAEGQVSDDIVEWLRLRSGDGLLGEYEAFLQRRSDWPGLRLMREKGEAAVARARALPAPVQGPLLLQALTSFVPFDFPGLGMMRAAKRLLTATVTAGAATWVTACSIVTAGAATATFTGRFTSCSASAFHSRI